MNFETFYFYEIRPLALKIAFETSDLRSFIYLYVNKLDESLYLKDKRKSCIIAKNWGEEINLLPITDYYYCNKKSFEKLKKLVNLLFEKPFKEE